MRRWPLTFWLGAGLIIACEVLLFVDVSRREFAVLPPHGGVVEAPVEGLARWVSVNMTPLCWVGYLLLFDGLLGGLKRRNGDRSGSPARSRPRRFALCFVTSVGVWLFFDWVNFFFIHAWDYYLVQEITVAHGYIAKFVAFGAISPAMFLAAELFQTLGLRHVRVKPLRLGRGWQVAMLVVGIPALVFPFVVERPIGCLGLWVSLVLVLDPLNHWLGRGRVPTLIDDWQTGRWGRTLSLAAGGLACGFLWEFWNHWAAAKWVYILPFLGPLERYKLFEMPLPGFGGFPPFALECWVAFQTILLAMAALKLRVAEPLPDHDAVL